MAIDRAASGQSAVRKFVVPADWKPGVYACRFRSGAAVSNTIVLNAPDPWWMVGNQRETASPGGWVRIFGKCLSLDKETPAYVLLRIENGADLLLKPRKAGPYSLSVDLPKDLAPGEYEVLVHNGFGHTAAWRRRRPPDRPRSAASGRPTCSTSKTSAPILAKPSWPR